MKDYQKKFLDDVFEKIKAGKKHISIVLSIQTSLNELSTCLSEALITNANTRVAIVYCKKDMALQGRNIVISRGIDANVDCYTSEEFSSQLIEYDYVILHDLDEICRNVVNESNVLKNSVTISFVQIGIQSERGDNLLNDFINRSSYNPLVYVYSTNNVLDIRDAKYADKEERNYIIKDNSATIRGLQNTRLEIVVERNQIKHQVSSLLAYYELFNKIKFEHQKSTEQTDDKDRELEALRAKEAELERRIKEQEELLKQKDEQLKQQEEMISFQQDILKGFGIDPKVIEESFLQIQKERAFLKDRLEDENEEIREIAIKVLQDKVAEVVNGLVQSKLSSKDYNYYKGVLIGKLTADVWNRLESDSQKFLITAQSSYKTLTDMPDKDSYDYSGVCLLVTKALEVETSKRFFSKYVDYLRRRYNTVSRWPYVLRQRENGVITDRVIPDNEFTLGSVVPVIGLKRNNDQNGNILSYSVYHEGTKREFFRYAKNELYNSNNTSEVEEYLDRDYHFIEKVRKDYRNPSAHKDGTRITTAEECLNYVIETEYMLMKMLNAMRI